MNTMFWQQLVGWLNSDFCIRLTQALLHFVWQGCVIAAAYAVFEMARPRATARGKYLVGVVGLLLMAASVPVTFAILPQGDTTTVSASRFITSRSSSAAPTQAGTTHAHGIQPVEQLPLNGNLGTDFRPEKPERAPEAANVIAPSPTLAERMISIAPYVTALYACGLLGMLLRVFTGVWGGRRLRQRATLCADSSIIQLVAEQSRRMRLHFVPKVAWCANLSVPVVVGILQPMILMPAAFTACLTTPQLTAVLLHELAHIRRYDLIVNLLQRFIESALFFHPAVWWLSRRVSNEREVACDDLALSVDCSKLEYAEALIRAAELCTRGSNRETQIQAALAATGGNPSQFKRRIMRLMGIEQQRRVRLSITGLLLPFALAAVVLFVLSTWRNKAEAANQADQSKNNAVRTSQPKITELTAAEKTTRDEILKEIEQLGGRCEIRTSRNGPDRLIFQGAVRGPKVDDAFIKRVAQLKNLEFLWIYDAAITDEGMKEIGRITTLTNLQIKADGVTDAGLKELASLDNLKFLTMDSKQLTDVGLGHLQKLPKIEGLSVWSEKISDEGMRQLLAIPSLNSLGIFGQGITNAGIAALNGNKTLRDINLMSNKITDAGLLHLENTNLEAVSFGSPKITDAGVVSIAQLPRLIRLYLNDVPLTDAGLEKLKNHQELQGLYLSNTQATGAGLKSFKGFDKLAQISLSGPKVNDAAFAEMVNFPKLTHLSIGSSAMSRTKSLITDEALRELSSAKSIEYLELDTTSITDAGLLHLAALPKLQSVSVYRTKGLSEAGIKALQSKSPNVSIQGYDPEPTKVAKAATKKPKPKEPTTPLSLSGRAIDNEGKPIAGAKIYLGAQGPGYRRLAETTTDNEGKYKFQDVPLPIETTRDLRDYSSGAFEVFGQAEGYGFAWRPTKWYYADSKPTNMEPDGDEIRHFDKNDKIELDLKFSPAKKLSGQIVDDQGKPIPDVTVDVRYASDLPGTGRNLENSFRVLKPCGDFSSLNERTTVPKEMKIRKTDADGRFEFTALPPGARFRVWIHPPSEFAMRIIYAATEKDIIDDEGKPVEVDGMKLVFNRNISVPVRVLLGDSNEPAAKLLVSGYNSSSSHSFTTDENGRGTLKLPAGIHGVELLPCIGTPYLVTRIEKGLEVGSKPFEKPVVFRVKPAAVVEITALDAESGKGIKDLRYWVEDPKFANSRGEHYFRSWEVATRIAHVERKQTDSEGKLSANFEPGKYRVGVGLHFPPEGYEVVEEKGQEIECVAGKTVQLTFHLRKLPEVKKTSTEKTSAIIPANKKLENDETVGQNVQERQGTTIAGRILGNDGKPAADVDVGVIARRNAVGRGGDLGGAAPVVLSQTKTDRDGKYSLQLAGVTSKTHRDANLVARVSGSGLTWKKVNLDDSQVDASLELPPEELISGRMVDADGKPAANVRYRMTAVMEKVEGEQFSNNALNFYDMHESDAYLSRWATTDSEGRFRVQCVPKNFGIALEIEGNDRFAIQSAMLNTGVPEKRGERDATYRPMVKNAKPGEELLLPLAPAQIFTGTVTYSDTSKPAPNARLTIWASQQKNGGSMISVAAKADENGVYRVNPYPGVKFGITAYPPDGAAYSPRRVEPIHWEDQGPKPREINIKLPRGVLIRGQVLEEGTNQPIAGSSVQYVCEETNNPHHADNLLTGWQNIHVTGADGRFQMTVIPGPGRLVVHAPKNEYVVIESSSQEFEKNRPGGSRHYMHGVTRVDPAVGAEPVDVTFRLKKAASVRGQLVDENGKAVDQAIMINRFNISPYFLNWRGLTHDVMGGNFEITGLAEDKEQTAYFLDTKRKLGATLQVKAGMNSPSVVLKPCGKVKMRFVDQDKQPVAGYEPSVHMIVTPGTVKYGKDNDGKFVADTDFISNFDRENHQRPERADKEGHLTVAALIPGGTYQVLTFLNKKYTLAKEFTASSEEIELGDITVDRPENKDSKRL